MPVFWEHLEEGKTKPEGFCEDWGDRKASVPAKTLGKKVPRTRRQQETTD